jgi:hypothetical protein
MKLSVIFEDKMIVVDGVSLKVDERLVAPDTNFRAVQWLGENGWIEVFQGDRIWLTNEADVVSYVTLFNTIVIEQQAAAEAWAQAERAAAAAAAQNGSVTA